MSSFTITPIPQEDKPTTEVGNKQEQVVVANGDQQRRSQAPFQWILGNSRKEVINLVAIGDRPDS